MLLVIAVIGYKDRGGLEAGLITLIPMLFLFCPTHAFKEAIEHLQEVRTQVAHLNTFFYGTYFRYERDPIGSARTREMRKFKSLIPNNG